MDNIISLILVHAMKSLNSNEIIASPSKKDANDSSYDLPMNFEDRARLSLKNKSVSMKLDMLEAKTLFYCTKALNTLISQDINSYLKKDLSFRISLFK